MNSQHSSFAFIECLKKIVFCTALSTFFVGLFSVAHANEDICPAWAHSSQTRLVSGYEFRDDSGPIGELPKFHEMSFYRYANASLIVPFGYRNPWPASSEAFRIISSVSESSHLAPEFAPSFAFWMPSLRFVERNLELVSSRRPCEAGRPKPEEKDYVVKIKLLAPFTMSPEGERVHKLFEVTDQDFESHGKTRLQGLVNFEHSLDGPISGSNSYNVYDSHQGVRAQLRCSAYIEPDSPKNPLCHGYVFVAERDLAFSISFPSSQGFVGSHQAWIKPVSGALSLLEKWNNN